MVVASPSQLPILDLVAGITDFTICAAIHVLTCCRICPGQHLAYANVWISIASLLATIEFSKATDERGFEITPDPVITLGVTR